MSRVGNYYSVRLFHIYLQKLAPVILQTKSNSLFSSSVGINVA
jgi:hypothetical protein